MKATRPSTKVIRAGYTLIELMITLAVVAILSTIAMDSYQSVMAKGDRATAISDIVKIAQSLQRYFSFNRTYSNDFGDLSMASSASFTAKISDAHGLYDYYVGIPGTTTISNVPQGETYGPSYIIYARPTPNNRDRWTLSYNEQGFKTHFAGHSTTAIDGWP